MKFAATYKSFGQVGENSYQDYAVTKVFHYTQTLEDVMTWLKSCNFENPTINDVQISHVVEDKVDDE